MIKTINKRNQANENIFNQHFYRLLTSANHIKSSSDYKYFPTSPARRLFLANIWRPETGAAERLLKKSIYLIISHSSEQHIITNKNKQKNPNA